MAPVFVVLWSSAFVAGVIGTKAASPLFLVFARLIIAGVLLAGITLAMRAPWPRGKQLLHVAVAGLLIQAVQFGALYTAISYGLPGGLVALVQGLSPVVVALLAAPVLGERIGRMQWAGFGLGTIGVVLAVVGQLHISGFGVVLCVIGLLGMGVGTVYQKRFVPDMDPRSGTTVQFLVSAVALGLTSLLVQPPQVAHWGSFVASLAWLVFMNSIAAYLLLNTMLRRMAANRVSTLFFVTPAVSALLAWLIVGQTLPPLGIVGLVVAGLGVLLATRR
jgi:drug/metabolite transporter (DMT)-like permease